jgi:TatD DNase family protein
MEMIDTHAHLYLSEFDADRYSIIKNALSAGVEKILLPAIDASTHNSMLQVEQEFAICKAMMGLHPCSVTIDYLNEIKIIKDYLQQRRFVAIGETGLDFYWDKTFVQQQYEAFHLQIQLALEYNLPIAIHSRNATDECIEVIKQYPALKGVFHCFSGTVQQAETVFGFGFLLGIGGVVTFKNSGLDKVIESTGISHIVLETDAPYLAPVPFRGKRNESSYLKFVVDKISSITKIDSEEVAKITTQNARKLFQLL